MSRAYAPHTETWWTVRSWLKFYGAYQRGFLRKARELVLAGQPFDAPILHVCAGRLRDYQTRGFGPNDKCLDLDPSLKPDILADARDPKAYNHERWAAILADPPYSAEDADHYPPGRVVFPSSLRHREERHCGLGAGTESRNSAPCRSATA
jgi:hypothetical protein